MVFKNTYGDKVLIIFIAPPSIESLRDRIINDAKRGKTPNSELNTRLETAIREMEFEPEADEVIINQDGKVDIAYHELKNIIAKFI